MSQYYNNYFDQISKGLVETTYYHKNNNIEAKVFYQEINHILTSCRDNKYKIFFFGNGASSAFANHMALDFSKNGKILSKTLSDSAMISALSNDYSYEEAMVEFLKIEGVTKNDLVITISSSGNSPNIVSVLNYCNLNSINSIALSGLKKDNKSLQLANYSAYVPMKTYGMVECIHQVILHLILDELMCIYEWKREDFQNMNKSQFKL